MIDNTVSQLHDEPIFEDELREPSKAKTRLEILLDQDRSSLLMECRETITLLDEQGEDRKAINAEMDAVRKKLFAMGISKEALAIAVKVSRLNEKEMDGFFLCLAVLFESIGKPFDPHQMELLL
jgi:hypothetical protein